jgi:hypothetical protein
MIERPAMETGSLSNEPNWLWNFPPLHSVTETDPVSETSEETQDYGKRPK